MNMSTVSFDDQIWQPQRHHLLGISEMFSCHSRLERTTKDYTDRRPGTVSSSAEAKILLYRRLLMDN